MFVYVKGKRLTEEEKKRGKAEQERRVGDKARQTEGAAEVKGAGCRYQELSLYVVLRK